MAKSKVTIKFTSLTSLWSFRTTIAVNIYEMNLSEISITCECTKEEVELALQKFKGKLVQMEKQTA